MSPINDSKKVQMKDYFQVHYLVLKVFGISIQESKNPFLNFAYRIYAIGFIMLFFYMYSLAEAIDLVNNFEDLDTSTFTLSYLLSHILGICKLTLVIIFRDEINKYCKTLEEGVFVPNAKRGGDVEFQYIEEAIRTYNRQAYFFHAFVVIIVGQRALYAVLDSGEYVDFFDKTANITISRHIRLTPFSCWLPFEPIGYPFYEMASIYQVSSAIFFGFIIGACDAIICGILCHIKAQFLILKNCLDSFLERAQFLMLEDGIDVDIENYKNPRTSAIEKLPPDLQKYVDICINDCVRHHQEIIFLAEGSEKTFNWLMLIQFLGSLLLICFQLFQLSLYELSSFRFFSMACYLMLMSFQVLIFCWHGNEVMLESQSLIGATFACNWIVTSPATQKTLALMMTRAFRPIRMTAGKFAFLSLETFMSLIRGSGSYFMVLRNMNKIES